MKILRTIHGQNLLKEEEPSFDSKGFSEKLCKSNQNNDFLETYEETISFIKPHELLFLKR